MFKSCNGNILLDCQIKTHDGWAARVIFLWEISQERAQSATTLNKKNIYGLHIESGHPSKSITHATAKAMGIQVTGTFKLYENCTLGKDQKSRVSKKAVYHLKILGERLYLYMGSPSTSIFEGKKHWLLVVENRSNYAWSLFLKETLDLAGVMLG